MKVAFLTQWYPPEPATIPAGIAASLARRGLSVRVVTGIPNYPSGQVAPGYAAIRPMTEMLDGVHVHRAPLYPSHDKSVVRRATNYLSWAAAASITGRQVLRDADVVLVYSSPATAAIPAMIRPKPWRKPFALLIQDVWPDSVLSTGFVTSPGLQKFSQRMLEPFTKAAYRASGHIAVTSPGMTDLLVDRGVPRQKLSLVYNWADEQRAFSAVPDRGARQQICADDEMLIMYAGNMGVAQGLGPLVDAMAQLRALPVHLLLVGGGVDADALARRAERLGLDKVHFRPALPPKCADGLIAASDVQIVSLRDEPLFQLTMPSKIQHILASGKPVIAAAGGDVATVVRDSAAGWAVPPGDVAAMANAIRAAYLSRDSLVEVGRRGRDYYTRQMSEAVSADRLVRALEAAVAPSARATAASPEPSGLRVKRPARKAPGETT